jgi:hypothetical protein
LLAATGASALAARSSGAREVREIRCDTLEAEGNQILTVEAPYLHVLRDTAVGGRYRPTLRRTTASIMCSRNSIIPAAYDDEVIWLGMPLHIAQMGTPGRLAVLEINEGRFRYRMIEGRQPSPEEQAAIDARLAEFQARFPPTR